MWGSAPLETPTKSLRSKENSAARSRSCAESDEKSRAPREGTPNKYAEP